MFAEGQRGKKRKKRKRVGRYDIFRVTVSYNATLEKARKRRPRRILRNREYFPPFATKLTPWERPSNPGPRAKKGSASIAIEHRYRFMYRTVNSLHFYLNIYKSVKPLSCCKRAIGRIRMSNVLFFFYLFIFQNSHANEGLYRHRESSFNDRIILAIE